MRPRYLEIEGLQSFKQRQSVDFDKLGEGGLFGIFGPTGSGKSTVLDAITLALFGNVQRASRGTLGIINTDSAMLRVLFRFDMVREGQKKTYCIERLYRRRKDSDNAAEAKSARLFELRAEGSHPLADKPGEVTDRVIELLGLEPDDFMRSVVLPQNRFQEFLMLDKAKKREMLERIFYLEEYGRQLSERVGRQISSVRNTLASIQGAMGALGDSSESAVREAGKKLEEAAENNRKLSLEFSQAEKSYMWAKEVRELSGELERVAEKEHMQDLSRDEINKGKKRYEDAIKASGLKDAVIKYRNTQESLKKAASELEQVTSEMVRLEDSLRDATASREAAEREALQEKPGLMEKTAKLQEAAKVKDEANAMDRSLQALRDQFSGLREQIAAADRETAELKQVMEEAEAKEAQIGKTLETLRVDIDYRQAVQEGAGLQKELEKAMQDLDQYRQKHNTISVAVSILEKELKSEEEKGRILQEEGSERRDRLAAHEKRCPGDRNSLLAALEEYHRISRIAGEIKRKFIEIRELDTSQEDAGKQGEILEQQLSAINERISVLDVRLNEKKEKVCGLEQKLQEDAARRIADRLKEGEPCPVCGSTTHPRLAVHASESTSGETPLQDLKAAVAELEQELRAEEAKKIRLTEQCKNMEKQKQKTIHDREQKYGEFIHLSENLPDAVRGAQPAELERYLEQIRLSNDDRQKSMDGWEDHFRKLKESLEEKDREISDCNIKIHGLSAEIRANREHLDQAKNQLEQAENDCMQKRGRYTEFLGKYRLANPRDELRRFEESDRHCEKLQKELGKIREDVRTCREKLDQVGARRSGLGNTLAEVENDGKNIRMQKEKAEERIRGLAADGDLDKVMEETTQQLHSLEKREKQTAERAKKLENNFNEAALRRGTLESQCDIYGKSLADEGKMLQDSMGEAGFDTMDAALAAVLPKEQLQALDARIREFEQEARNLKAGRDLLERKLSGRCISQEEWEAAQARFGSARISREEGIKALEAARIIYGNRQENYSKWVELEKQNRKHAGRLDLLEQIQKLLKGNGFVEYIAEERLRYIALEASETLARLTRHRYALEMDPDCGFVIRDYSNGGAIRMVSSLSGGETFLVSLSLALALSKQIQLKGQSPLEFFFLDEGFGTLDADLLDNVMDSLERLNTGERMIGLISHVPQLKSRMARRLIVEPPSPAGEGTRVFIETA